VILLVAEPVDRAGGILTLTRLMAEQLSHHRPVHVISRAGGSAWATSCSSSRGSTALFIAQAMQHATMSCGADVVATHLNLAPLALVGAQVARGRCVLMLHGLEISAARTRIRCWAARHVNLAVAVSQATAFDSEILLQLPPAFVRVVTPGVNHRESPPRQDPGSPVRLLTVTRLVEGYKNVDTVIAALREPSLSLAQLTIVGDGPTRPALQKLASKLSVADRVSFTGAVDDSTLEKIYRGSDLFVLPSTQEGFGLVYAEAMAYGLPCIGARGCGSEDAIIDGTTGRLVDEPGPETVAAAAAWALDPRRYVSLSAQAVDRARHELSADAFGRRLLAALDGVDG
jgi:phosphatidyl-myo-inositol dimannoside synthase